MSVMMRGALELVLILSFAASAGCQRDAVAQVTREPTAPVRCFVIADAAQLSEQSGIELCQGALSEAPGQCYASGLDEFHNLSSQKLLTLCSSATSLEPLGCYRQLQTSGTLTEDQIISYCQTRCDLGPPPPQASSAACLDAAIGSTNLSLQLAGELCLGSTSPEPVACFLAGLDLHKVADSSLIRLCRERLSCQY